jgi:hypothetical protein
LLAFGVNHFMLLKALMQDTIWCSGQSLMSFYNSSAFGVWTYSASAGTGFDKTLEKEG